MTTMAGVIATVTIATTGMTATMTSVNTAATATNAEAATAPARRRSGGTLTW